MPRYNIFEYRGVDIIGLAASSKSTIYATDIINARLSAECTNYPKGEWKVYEGIHIKGDVEDGNVSIVIPIESQKMIEYDVNLAFQKATFQATRVYTAYCDFLNHTYDREDPKAYNTLPPTLAYFYRKLLTRIGEQETAS